jgi:hypothetical protein
MTGVSALAALFQAVVNFVQARVVAIFAVVNALMHFRRLMFMNVAHFDLVSPFRIRFSAGPRFGELRRFLS